MTVNYSAVFVRQLKRLKKKFRSIRDDLQPLLDGLQAGVTPGDQIPGVGYTAYKVRLPNTDAGRGKSSGYRVIYYLETEADLLLLTIYSKTEQSDLAPHQVKRIIDEEFSDE